MPTTVEALRAAGSQKITLRTNRGEITGRITQASIPDSALMILFASDGPPEQPLVVALDDIDEIVQR